MTFNQFVHAVEVKVQKEVDKKISVQIHTSLKNNGTNKKGLLMMEKGINISPTIYLEEYYQQYKHGNTLDDIVVNVVQLYDEVRFQQSFDSMSMKKYESLKSKIVYHVISKEKNGELLAEVPYIPYLDMAIVFYVLIEVNELGTATMLIKKEHLQYWKKELGDVYQQACENTEKLLPIQFKTMEAVIAELGDVKKSESAPRMYVLTNNIRSFGAATILYNGKLKEIGEKVEDNYYILPSSVHEVIIIPESEAPGRQMLTEMVVEINATQVEEEEVLSNHVYYYDRKKEALVYE